MVCEVSRWVIALGSVAAGVGLVVLGMGTAYAQPDDGQITLGLVLMIGGSLAAIVAGLVYRNSDEPDISTH